MGRFQWSRPSADVCSEAFSMICSSSQETVPSTRLIWGCIGSSPGSTAANTTAKSGVPRICTKRKVPHRAPDRKSITAVAHRVSSVVDLALYMLQYPTNGCQYRLSRNLKPISRKTRKQRTGRVVAERQSRSTDSASKSFITKRLEVPSRCVLGSSQIYHFSE